MLVRGGPTQELLGACPLYLKGHSYGRVIGQRQEIWKPHGLPHSPLRRTATRRPASRASSVAAPNGNAPHKLSPHDVGCREYVFDQSWANAYERSVGSDYYPKLQSCVPFTPVTGPRLLARPGRSQRAVRDSLAVHLPAVADQLGVSSLHVTFSTKEEAEALCGRGGAFLQRTGIQASMGRRWPGYVARAALAEARGHGLWQAAMLPAEAGPHAELRAAVLGWLGGPRCRP